MVVKPLRSDADGSGDLGTSSAPREAAGAPTDRGPGGSEGAPADAGAVEREEGAPASRQASRRGNRRVQPGLKVRGREYLRIIYGPDYTEPGNLVRLRDRKLDRKRSLALREYALGLEAIGRLVDDEPLWRVHEAVFGVLALESEPVDPRL